MPPPPQPIYVRPSSPAGEDGRARLLGSEEAVGGPVLAHVVAGKRPGIALANLPPPPAPINSGVSPSGVRPPPQPMAKK